MKKVAALFLAVCMLILMSGCNADPAAEPKKTADSVLYGKIVTMDDTYTVAQAVAVKDGKIVFVGSRKNAEEYIGEETVV